MPCAYLRVGSSGRRFCDDKKRTIIERSSCERDGRQPDHLDLKKGEQVRFVIENKGLLKHEFMLASAKDNDKHAEMMRKFPDMEHDDPNGKRVAPHSQAEILWKFTKTGEFEYACLIPTHYDFGMFGKVVVK